MISTALASVLREELGDDEAIIANRRPRPARDDPHRPQSVFHVARHRADQHRRIIEDVLLRFEQQLAHLRENLRGPELRELFESANRYGQESGDKDGKQGR